MEEECWAEGSWEGQGTELQAMEVCGKVLEGLRESLGWVSSHPDMSPPSHLHMSPGTGEHKMRVCLRPLHCGHKGWTKQGRS